MNKSPTIASPHRAFRLRFHAVCRSSVSAAIASFYPLGGAMVASFFAS
jgi:hypothetical protein